MYVNRFDSHTHSENSPDANHSVICMCERAIEIGLMGFCITDHMDCQDNEEYNYFARVEQSIFDVQKAQAVLGDKMILTQGIELAQPLEDLPLAEATLALTDYDFVLGSCHALKGKPDFYFWDFTDPEVVLHDTLKAYFDEQIQLARWGKFDCLAHMNYISRYAWGRNRVPVDLTPYDDQIDLLFKTLIEGGKGIEVNTSGLRQGLGVTLPDLGLIKRYRQLGGEIITIGSDAHFAEDLGAGVETAMDLLKEAGFRYFTFFREREPRMLKLV